MHRLNQVPYHTSEVVTVGAAVYAALVCQNPCAPIAHASTPWRCTPGLTCPHTGPGHTCVTAGCSHRTCRGVHRVRTHAVRDCFHPRHAHTPLVHHVHNISNDLHTQCASYTHTHIYVRALRLGVLMLHPPTLGQVRSFGSEMRGHTPSHISSI